MLSQGNTPLCPGTFSSGETRSAFLFGTKHSKIIVATVLELEHHVYPIPSTVLALAWSNLLESGLFVVANKFISTNKCNPLGNARVFYSLGVAFEQYLPKTFASKARMYAQRMKTYCLAVFIVACAGIELIICFEVLWKIHGVVCDYLGG